MAQNVLNTTSISMQKLSVKQQCYRKSNCELCKDKMLWNTARNWWSYV